MKQIWSYIALFFAGLSAGILLMISKIKPVINADSYIETNSQSIRKLKQRGEGNEQNTKGEICAYVKQAEKKEREERRYERMQKRGLKKLSKRTNNK